MIVKHAVSSVNKRINSKFRACQDERRGLACPVLSSISLTDRSYVTVPRSLLEARPSACPVAIRSLRYFGLLTSDCTSCQTELEREILSTEQVARNWAAVNAVGFSQVDNFKDEDFSSSTWMFVVQVTAQSRISIEGVTAKSDDCQGFCVGNEATNVFQKAS